MIKRQLVLLVMVCTICSCSKSPIACFTPPEPVRIRLVDKNRNDLLNPKTSKAYKPTEIKLYHMEDGIKVYSQISLDSIAGANLYFLITPLGFESDQGRNFSLELSPALTDHLYVRSDQMDDNDCTFYKFVEFKYNDISYTPTNAQGINSLQFFEITKQ